jgi:hypothetical protein
VVGVAVFVVIGSLTPAAVQHETTGLAMASLQILLSRGV